MAARRAIRIRTVDAVAAVYVDDPQVERALSTVRDSVGKLETRAQRTQVRASLEVGQNRIAHGLGRPFHGFTITPTVADASFAYAIDTTNPRPDLEVWISVVGVAQPDAPIDVW